VTPPTPAELDALAAALGLVPVAGPGLAAAARLLPALLEALERQRAGFTPDQIAAAVPPDLHRATGDLLL
jgi:hypothetical protein